MEFLQLIAYKLFFPFAVIAIMHFKLNDYPEPLPRERDLKKGMWESHIMWLILISSFLILMHSPMMEVMANPTASGLLLYIAIMTFPYVLIPVVYFRTRYKWNWQDFGFRMPVVNSRGIIIFTILLLALTGLKPLMGEEFTPKPMLMIVFALAQPAFFEEFFFRGFLQSRLERLIGQNKAWLYGGLLFGVVHLPFNYLVADMDFVTGIVQFMSQTAWGCVFGLLFMKTRSLYPGMVAHFLTNGIFASIIAQF